jgi:hypothetical protein
LKEPWPSPRNTFTNPWAGLVAVDIGHRHGVGKIIVGRLAHDEAIALNLRHAELHLGFHVPE